MSGTSAEETNQPPSENSQINLPADIELRSHAVEIAFHPFKDILAAGTENGRVLIYSYTADPLQSNHKLMTFPHHKESCRAVHFSNSGDYLFSGSSDTTIHTIDLDVGAAVRRLAYKQGAAIYSLLSVNKYLLVSGDDDGRVILWDFRRALPVSTFKPCVEYISCLKVSADKRTLLATSGEGSLFAFDLRAAKLDYQSELYKDEFVTAAVVKNEKKVIVGASEGVFYIFNWGEWAKVNEKFNCQTGSIDIIVAADDDVICAGCDDGYIRAVNICPNKVLGVIGSHDAFPVEGLAITHDSQYVASCSYDRKIKFHDLSVIKKFTNA